MGPLLMEGSWQREEQRGRLGERKGKLEKWKKIRGNCFEFFSSVGQSHFCSGLLVREAVGCTHWHYTTLQ